LHPFNILTQDSKKSFAQNEGFLLTMRYDFEIQILGAVRMNIKPLLLLVSLVSAGSANAMVDESETDKESEWTVGITGGIATLKQSSDQFFGSVSLDKDFADSYAGIAISYIDSGSVPGLIGSIPASTTEFTLSAGTSFDALNLDGYAAYGRRNFDTETLARSGQLVTIDSSGESLGAGLAFSFDIAASEQVFVTPIVSVDYNKLDIARVAVLPNGDRVAVSNNEDGVTGSLGVAVQVLFGADDQHLFSVLGNGVTTSNTTSFNPGNAQYPVLRALASRDEPGQKDSWGELGASISFALGNQTRLDFSMIRTFGFLNSDVTSVSSGLRFSF